MKRLFSITILILSLISISLCRHKKFTSTINCVLDHNEHRATYLRNNETSAAKALEMAKDFLVDTEIEYIELKGTNVFINDDQDQGDLVREKDFCNASVSDWFNQVLDYNSLASDTVLANKMRFYAEYIQMVWKSSTSVGCAYAQNSERTVVVCKYWPPGNDPKQIKNQVRTNSKERNLLTCKLEDLCKLRQQDIFYDKGDPEQTIYDLMKIYNRLMDAHKVCESRKTTIPVRRKPVIEYESDDEDDEEEEKTRPPFKWPTITTKKWIQTTRPTPTTKLIPVTMPPTTPRKWPVFTVPPTTAKPIPPQVNKTKPISDDDDDDDMPGFGFGLDDDEEEGKETIDEPGPKSPLTGNLDAGKPTGVQVNPLFTTKPTLTPITTMKPIVPPAAGGQSGLNGANGQTGLNGRPGLNGANGVNGQNGANGVNGQPGLNGRPGLNGANGVNMDDRLTRLENQVNKLLNQKNKKNVRRKQRGPLVPLVLG